MKILPNVRVSFLSVWILLIPFLAFTQTGKVPLKTLLEEAESEFGVSFSYQEQTIASVTCTRPDYSAGLDEVLKALSACSGLRFEKIDEKFIAIRRKGQGDQAEISICGTLIDSDSGEPIPYATISTGGGSGTSSDVNGNFTLAGVGLGITITIRSIGYVNISLSAAELTECPSIKLQRSVTTLDEIVIRDYLVSGVALNASGNISVSARDLGILPGLTEPDVLLTIQTLPGIISVQESVSDINIRGGTNDQNLVLWEDMRMFQTGHFFGLISAFNPYVTNEVNLIQQGTPARYGDAVSGVLDIRSDDEIAREFQGGAGINMINADIHSHIPLIPEKASILVSARRSIADLVETPTYTAYFDRAFQNSDIQSAPTSNRFTADENFQFNDVSVKLLADPGSRWKVRGNFLWTENDLTYAEEAEISGRTDSRNSGLSQKSLAGNVKVAGDIHPDISFGIMAYISTYSLSAVNNDIFNDQRLIQENEVIDGGIKADLEYRLSKSVEVGGGYHFSETGVTNLEDINNPVFRRRIKRVLRIHSPYAQGTFRSTELGLFVNGGIRFQYLDKFNMLLAEPRLSVRKRIANGLHVEISAEKKSQSITQVIDFQTDFLGIEKRRWLLSNDSDIPVAISYQYAGGVQAELGPLIFRAIAYHREVDGVSTATQGFQNEFQFERVTGGYTVNGADLLINLKSDAWNSWLAYTFARNTFQSDSLLPSSFPNTLDVRHAVSAGFSFENQRIRASAGLNWHTGRPYSRAIGINNAGDIIYEPPNSSRLSDYLRLDASCSYKFSLTKGIRGEAGLSVWNILDRLNISNIFYRRSGDEITEVRQEALGLTPNAMFRIYF